MARKPKALPDYFTAEDAQALVAAAPSYPTRMAMRIMLRTGLRVSECLSLCAADLRLSQDPPIISLLPEVTGNKSKKGREVPVPDDLVESLGDLASVHAKDRQRPLFDVSRQWGQQEHEGSGPWRRGWTRPGPSFGVDERTGGTEAGLDPPGPIPMRSGTPYGLNAVFRGVPTPVLQFCLGHRSLAETERYVDLAGGHSSWWRGCEEGLAQGSSRGLRKRGTPGSLGRNGPDFRAAPADRPAQSMVSSVDGKLSGW